MPKPEKDPKTEGNYRIEVRFDFHGTKEEAEKKAQEAASAVGGEVTAMFDDDWEEV